MKPQTPTKNILKSCGSRLLSLKLLASDMTLMKWINERSPRPVKKVNEPIKLIEGVLSEYRGKYTSVELQHEATKLWAKNTD